MMMTDNDKQFVGAEKELRQMVNGLNQLEIQEFCGEKGMHWKLTTPAAPHQNGCAEALVKTCKNALRKAIGSQLLTPFELYTVFLEVANLVNQRPIGRVPNDPDDGGYISPNHILLGEHHPKLRKGHSRNHEILATELNVFRKLSTRSGSVGAETFSRPWYPGNNGKSNVETCK